MDRVDARPGSLEQKVAEINGKLDVLVSHVVLKRPIWWQMPLVIRSTVALLGAMAVAAQRLCGEPHSMRERLATFSRRPPVLRRVSSMVPGLVLDDGEDHGRHGRHVRRLRRDQAESGGTRRIHDFQHVAGLERHFALRH